VIHYLPWFGGGLLLCLFTGISKVEVYFFATSPFSGAGCVPPTPPLSVFYYSLLFVFQFCRAVWFWMLLSGSGDDLCDPIPTLGVAYHLPALSLHCLSYVCLLIVWY
jgi:hypothetical protein